MKWQNAEQNGVISFLEPVNILQVLEFTVLAMASKRIFQRMFKVADAPLGLVALPWRKLVEE